jgi:hypothetical protein
MSTSLSAPYGLLAEFPGERELVAAARRVREAGYTRFDAFSPYPIHELSETVAHGRRSRVPILTFLGGALGALTGFALQYWSQVHVYPMNIGGRPHNSWPAFIVVCFELTILFASLATVVGMIFLNKLPMPYHPVFNAPSFLKASRDGYFLVVEAEDPRFDLLDTEQLLVSLDAHEVVKVEQ